MLNRSARRAFTLVEILIVVVILGILAAIVIPHASNASQEAIKSALRRDLQVVSEQIEIYRVQNAGRMPSADPTAPFGASGSWGVLVSQGYLSEPPFNQFTGGMVLGPASTAASAMAAPRGHPVGWQYVLTTTRLDVYASGYDAVNNRLSNE
jgi:prepilin-type N-terminal cleavage/methylation domain-containing protein